MRSVIVVHAGGTLLLMSFHQKICRMGRDCQFPSPLPTQRRYKCTHSLAVVSLVIYQDKPIMEELLSRVKKPSEAERVALSKCFPGGKVKVSGNAGVFNPSVDYRKKKQAVAKPSKVEVFMLKHFQKMIPKGESRRRLRRKGRVCDISFTRSMTNLQVEACVKKSFKNLKIDKFSLLETDSSGHFLSHSPVKIDGDGVVRRRGALYLCEVSSEIVFLRKWLSC